MNGNVVNTCSALLAFLGIVLVCTGAGCLVGSEDSAHEPKAVNMPFRLDLDGDGTPDFLFYQRTLSSGDIIGSSEIRISPTVRSGNAIVKQWLLADFGGEKVWTTGPLAAIEEGVRLDSTLSDSLAWEDSGGTLCFGGGVESWKGPFAGAQKKYLGLRLGRGDSARYGWVLLSVDTTTASRSPLEYPTVLLHDYAVSKPGTPIKTGEKP